MILYIACVLAAVLWLSFRLYRLLSIPLPKIVSSLRLTTPPAVKAAIDKVASDSITIHWENEPDSDKFLSRISHFVLYLDNVQIATFPNSPDTLYTCCMITNLEPQRQYQLDFITVNELGFTNRLPSFYCMTRMDAAEVPRTEDSPDALNQPPVDLNSPHIPGDNIPGSPVMAKTRKWRRNTISSINQVDVASMDPQAAAAQVPAYTNLTKLEDLEKFTIDDLKKILICAQEDLHDVLSQQTTAIQDFQENKLSLELELDNLKAQLSHEIEFKKSIKSNIKSLENAKLLSDLKYDKANEKIENIQKKMEKMNTDMKAWDDDESNSLDRDKMTAKYNKLIKEEEAKVTEITDSVKALQQSIAKQETTNKKLNVMKKSTSSTNLKDHANNNSNQASQNANDNLQQTLKLLKKIDECISDKTGLLNASGEHYLSKLNANNPAVQLIKEQLKIDEEAEQSWKSKRVKLLKRIKNLDAKFAAASVENGKLKTNLFARTYQPPMGSPSDIAPVVSASSYNSSGLNSGAFNNSDAIVSPSENLITTANQYTATNQNQNTNPLLSAFSVPNTLDNASTKPSMDYSLNDDVRGGVTISPRLNKAPLSKSLSGATQSAVDNGDSIYPVSSFSRGIPTTATTDAIAAPSFPWGSSDQQPSSVQNSQLRSSFSNDFEYDNNNNHLITGLENMIYGENDNADKVSNYSKAYTTDQLDSYWSSQKDTSNGSILPQRYNSDTKAANTSNSSLGMAFNSEFTPINHPTPSYANDMTMPMSSSPLATHATSMINHTPHNSVSMMQPQSLLAATLNDQNAMSPFPDSMQMSESETAFRSTMGNGNPGMSSFMSPHLPLSPSASQSMSGIVTDANMMNFTNQVQNFPNSQGLGDTANPLDVTAVTGTPLALAKPDDEVTKGHASRNSHDMFHSPSFKFIWQTTTSPSKSSGKMNSATVPNLLSSPTKSEATKEHTLSSPAKSKRNDSNATHKRDKSAGSISSWGNRLSLKSRQSVASTVVEDSQSGGDDDRSVGSGAQESTQSSNRKTGSGSSSRRISRLLSKSGMNNLFNLQGHDAQPSTPT